jgi:hypothetical protein
MGVGHVAAHLERRRMIMSSLSSALCLAYLDPGSGSALVGTVIALAGAALFSAKSLFYRLLGKGRPTGAAFDADSIALVSEGRNYWSTFRPIVEELIRRKINFRYYTLDLLDPALEIETPCMQARLFDSTSPAAYVKLTRIKAPVMLATTPNLGSEGYPVRRPPGVRNLVHVFHAFADVSAYHLGSLDHYDTVILVGPHQVAPLRQVEAARGLPAKELVALGLPYIDDQARRLKDRSVPPRQPVPTVLVASSWGTKGCLQEYGTGFIRQLAAAGFQVIVRPHPQSLITEADLLARCERETAGLERIRWDRSTVGLDAMAESDILVSDTSSIRFDYAFLFGKPVVTLDIPRERQTEYESIYMDHVWTEAAASRIGIVVGQADVPNLAARVRQVLAQEPGQSLVGYRGETISNFGRSAQAIVSFLEAKRQTVLQEGRQAP